MLFHTPLIEARIFRLIPSIRSTERKKCLEALKHLNILLGESHFCLKTCNPIHKAALINALRNLEWVGQQDKECDSEAKAAIANLVYRKLIDK